MSAIASGRSPKLPMGPSRWSIRRRLEVLSLITVIAGMVALTVGFNLLFDSLLHQDAERLLRQQVTILADHVRTDRDQRALHPDTHDSEALPLTWVFVNGAAVVDGRGPAVVKRAATSLDGRAAKVHILGNSYWLRSQVLTVAGTRATVVAGIAFKPYANSIALAWKVSLLLLGLIIVFVWLLTRGAIGLALSPVRQMVSTVEEWVASGGHGRFRLRGADDEIVRLAMTLDRLLDRIDASLRHEQQFSAEVSHELRVPISVLSAEVELALRQPRSGDEYRQSLQVILETAQQMATTVEALVSAARHEEGLAGRATCDLVDVVESLVARQGGHAQVERVVQIEVVGDGPFHVGVAAGIAERIIEPVLSNARQYCDASVNVQVSHGIERVLVEVIDDGPGLDVGDSAMLFASGRRGQVGVDRAPGGAGLGLALAQRLARAVGGDVQALPSDAGGRFAISFPPA